MTPIPENRLLAALPPGDYSRLAARTTRVTFRHHATAYLAGGPIDFVYLPLGGVMSSVVVMPDGASAEVAAVGSEGAVGLSAFLGGTRSAEAVFCRVAPCECLRLPADEFAAEVALGGSLALAVHAYALGVLAAASRLIACNALHSVGVRCARALLTTGDRVGSDEFPVTQDFLAVMLGVRRASVTVAAGALQAAGLISYRHGEVTILDRPGLERAACGCYAAVRDATPAASPRSRAGRGRVPTRPPPCRRRGFGSPRP